MKLGLVAFLNSRPIGYGLLHGRQAGRFEVLQAPPAQIADRLANGTIALGLIPAVAYARACLAGAPIAIVPGIAIASRGPAESVLLFTKKPITEVASIALDPSSRTSVQLLRLLLRRTLRPGRPEPTWVPIRPELPLMLASCDAALIIGDRALFAAREHPGLVPGLQVYDLGGQWHALAGGVPFVYAVWAGAPLEEAGPVVAALQDSLAEGLAALPAIVREASGDDAATETVIRRYLSQTMRYALGADEIAGLETFLAWLAEDGLLDGPAPPLRFQA